MRVTHITPDDNEVNQADWAADHVIVTDTGWASYSHTGGAQAISANTRTQLTIDGGSKIDGQLPEGITALWSNNAITGINGDDRSGRIKLLSPRRTGTVPTLTWSSTSGA